MTLSTTASEILKESNTQIVKNDQRPPPNFKNHSDVEATEGEIGTLSSIPSKVLAIKDVQTWYMCKIGEVRYFELREAYENLCYNEALKDEHTIVIKRGLTHALWFSKVFKIE